MGIEGFCVKRRSVRKVSMASNAMKLNGGRSHPQNKRICRYVMFMWMPAQVRCQQSHIAGTEHVHHGRKE